MEYSYQIAQNISKRGLQKKYIKGGDYIRSKVEGLLTLYILEEMSDGKVEDFKERIDYLINDIEQDLLPLKIKIYKLWKTGQFNSEIKKGKWILKNINWLKRLYHRLDNTAVNKKRKKVIRNNILNFTNEYYWDLLKQFRNITKENKKEIIKELGLEEVL